MLQNPEGNLKEQRIVLDEYLQQLFSDALDDPEQTSKIFLLEKNLKNNFGYTEEELHQARVKYSDMLMTEFESASGAK